MNEYERYIELLIAESIAAADADDLEGLTYEEQREIALELIGPVELI